MKKVRFFYWIFSLIAIIFLIAFSLYNSKYFLLCTIAIAILSFSNIAKKRRESTEVREIIMNFINSCDAKAYIEGLQKFMKKCIFTKKQKAYFELNLALAYVDEGSFEKAKEILYKIDDYVNDFNDYSKLIYLKIWSDYFFNNRLDEKMKYTLVKVKEIIDQIPKIGLKYQFIPVYHLMECKYFLLTGTNLDDVRSYLLQRQSRETMNLSKLSIEYLLALVDLRENKFDDSRRRLKTVIDSNKNLFITTEAKRLINKLDIDNNTNA